MSAPIPTSSSADPRWRRAGLAVLLWLYGISTTIFLFSIWGRAVAADTDLLSSAASRAASSEMVTNRVEAWFDEVFGEAGFGEASSGLSEMVVAVPEVRSATADLAGDLVRAASQPSQGPVVVDVAANYRSAVPALTETLTSAGIPVEEEQVGAVVAELDPIVLEGSAERPPVGPRSGAARSLTVATLLALAAMVATGTVATVGSPDRRAMFRTLLNRLAVSAFTFLVFFRLSAWVLDPGGGRATVGGGVAELIGAKLWIPLLVAAIAGVAGWAVRRRRRVGVARYATSPAIEAER